MKKIAVLLTSYNRVNKTIECLNALFSASLPAGYSLSVYLVDDGSTDGTGEAVKNNFRQVNIIKGNGSLFWAGGMHLAWETAARTDKFDFYLWLNDDTYLEQKAILKLIESAESVKKKAIICASLHSLDKMEWTYGGSKILSSGETIPVLPNGYLQPCDLINGNCVLVPKYVFDSVGNLDPLFRHAIGDFDYSLRAQKLGIPAFATGEYLGCCDRNLQLPQWCLPEVPFYRRLKNLYSPLGISHPRLFFIYELRHWGLLIAIKHFISIHLRLIFPSMWPRK